MNRAQKIMEIVKEPIGGTAKRIRELERSLGIDPADLEAIEDIYDYFDELKEIEKNKKCSPNDRKNKESHHEDLWPASQPGFGDGAKTQLIPEQGGKTWRVQSKMGSVYGEFKAVTATGALNAWAKTRGYQSFDAMKKDGLAKSFEVMQGFRIIVEAKM